MNKTKDLTKKAKLANIDYKSKVYNYLISLVFYYIMSTSNKSSGQYLDEYMENRGFYFVPEEQMSGMLVYSNGSEKEYILFSINKYYSKWEWQ